MIYLICDGKDLSLLEGSENRDVAYRRLDALNEGLSKGSQLLMRIVPSIKKGRKKPITQQMVKDAIKAKLKGVPLRSYVKQHGVDLAKLSKMVNKEWGYTKPWPKTKC